MPIVRRAACRLSVVIATTICAATLAIVGGVAPSPAGPASALTPAAPQLAPPKILGNVKLLRNGVVVETITPDGVHHNGDVTSPSVSGPIPLSFYNHCAGFRPTCQSIQGSAYYVNRWWGSTYSYWFDGAYYDLTGFFEYQRYGGNPQQLSSYTFFGWWQDPPNTKSDYAIEIDNINFNGYATVWMHWNDGMGDTPVDTIH